MAQVFTLDAKERAALAARRRPSSKGLLGVVVADQARADALAPMLTRIVSAVEAATAVGAALASADELPGRATITALRDREAAWRDVEMRYGLLTAQRVAAAAGSRAANVNEYASAMSRSGRAVAIRRTNRLLFPAFQFDPNGRPRAGLKGILAVFRTADWSAESVVLWFSAPNGYLEDAEPAERLTDDPDAVLEAAKNAAADW